MQSDIAWDFIPRWCGLLAVTPRNLDGSVGLPAGNPGRGFSTPYGFAGVAGYSGSGANRSREADLQSSGILPMGASGSRCRRVGPGVPGGRRVPPIGRRPGASAAASGAPEPSAPDARVVSGTQAAPVPPRRPRPARGVSSTFRAARTGRPGAAAAGSGYPRGRSGARGRLDDHGLGDRCSVDRGFGDHVGAVGPWGDGRSRRRRAPTGAAVGRRLRHPHPNVLQPLASSRLSVLDS